MASTLKPDEFTSMWQERIIRSHKSKRRLVKDWIVLREFYEGRYFSDSVDNDQVSTNFLFSIIRQKMATLYFQNPTMNFRGLSQIGSEIAPIMKDFMLIVRRAIDAEAEERDALLKGLLYGTGILKHGYNAEFGIETPLSEDSVMGKLNRAGISSFDDFDLSKGIFTEHDLRVRAGYPWVKSISTFDFFADAEAMQFPEARWMAHRFRRPHADVVRDSRYDPEARKEVDPSGVGLFGVDDYESRYADAGYRDGDLRHDSSMVTLYEISDLENREVIVISDTGSRPLMRVPDPLGLADSPYEILTIYGSETSPWGLSYANQFAPLVEVLNKVRSDMLDHLDRHGRTRGIYNKSILSEDEAYNLVHQPEGGLMAVEWDSDESLSKAIEILPQETINPDAWRVANMYQSDLDQTSGVNENARGGSLATETATEASIIDQKSGLRDSDMQYQNTRFLRGSTRKLVAIIRKFWPIERIIPITGPDGQIFQLAHVTRDQVMSDFEVDIEPGSTERVDQSVQRRQIIDAIQQMVGMEPWMNRQGAGFNWIEVAKTFLKTLNLSTNPDKLILVTEPQQPQQPGNVLPFPQGQNATGINPSGQAPTELAGFESGRMLSEAGAL